MTGEGMKLEELLKRMSNGLTHSVEVEHIQDAAPEMLALLLSWMDAAELAKDATFAPVAHRTDALFARLRKEVESV